MLIKNNIYLSIIVPILTGVIVLLGVYIIVNNKKHVRFAVPEVTEEIIYYPDNHLDSSMIHNESVFLQQPTYFNPNHNLTHEL